MKKKLFRVIGAGVSLCAAGHVWAQTPADKTTVALEEVVVTAERRSESLQETPVSILSFSADALERANIRNMTDLQNFLPNVSMGGSVPVGNSAPNISIRGVGQTSGRANNEKGVGLYVDDIYYPRSTGSVINLQDVERIEVLRGPQGTLFGRNTTAGAIRYMTRRPKDLFEASLTGTVGSFDRTDLEAMINLPLSSTIAFRGQAALFKRDGYVPVIGTDRDRGGQDDFIARGTFRYHPGDALTADLTVARSESKSDGSPTVIEGVGLIQPNGFAIGPVRAYSAFLTAQGRPAIVANDPRFVTPDGYSQYDTCILSRVTRNPAAFGSSPTLLTDAIPQSELCDAQRSADNTFAALDVTYIFSDGLSLRSMSGYNKGTDIDQDDYGQLGAQTNRTTNRMESYSQELQLLGKSERFSWVGGLYYFRETPAEIRINREATVNNATQQAICCIGFDADVELGTRSYAGFGQATMELGKTRVTAGARYSYDDKDVSITKVGVFTPALPAGTNVQSNSDTWDSVDYRLTLDYRWTDALMGYATVSKGFKSGGFNIDIVQIGTARPAITKFDPETVINYEVGVRSQLFDNRVRFNVTGFRMKYDDLVVQLADFSRGALQVLFLNAGNIRITGFESELTYAASSRLTLSGNVGYTNIKYLSLSDNSPLFIPASCPGGALTFARCKAQPLARSPEWTYTLGATYSQPAFGGSLDASVNYAHKGDQYSNNSTSNSVLLPAYGVLNARLEFDSGKAWKIALLGTNLGDKRYITTGTNGLGNVLGTLSVSPGAPREWGLSATYRF